MSEAFVQFAGVSVRYGAGASAVQALERADLGFARGDFVCIVGPSGCGKTTMMQTLAGFLPPTMGVGWRGRGRSAAWCSSSRRCSPG